MSTPVHYPPPPLPEHEARNWAMAAHLSPLVIALLSGGILAAIAPLVIWLLYRQRSWLVDDQAKEALNFQITLAIAYVVGLVTLVFLVGVLIWAAAFVLAIVFAIQGSVAASRGERYRYPISIRFVR
ncbi:DUF4870 domain-containing protein [Xylanimonas allomyrinae]|uniref:DUF4870 domain-containing protein n=1 Tax=Xylanimonas allomyrinae TaxID=2509459 RepID=A0A4P6EKB9_9MICO|nr:DUF4870 domain-containing protein [Xylanimonas allomyrinae]QAY63062.1 DUF4870 domain-containing protein [Xylanimonas allomyrinae]